MRKLIGKLFLLLSIAGLFWTIFIFPLDYQRIPNAREKWNEIGNDINTKQHIMRQALIQTLSDRLFLQSVFVVFWLSLAYLSIADDNKIKISLKKERKWPWQYFKELFTRENISREHELPRKQEKDASLGVDTSQSENNEESPLIIENEVFSDDSEPTQLTRRHNQLITSKIRLQNNSSDPITNIEIRLVDVREEENNNVPIKFKGKLPYKLKTLPNISGLQRELVDIFSFINGEKWQYVYIGGKDGIEMFGGHPYRLTINVTSLDCKEVQAATTCRIDLKDIKGQPEPFLEIIDRFPLQEKKSPLKIEFEKDFFDDEEITNQVGLSRGTKRTYYCEIFNPDSYCVNNVNLYLKHKNQEYKLNKDNLQFSKGDREKIKLISYRNEGANYKLIHIEGTNEYIDIDFDLDNIFKIKVCGLSELLPTFMEFVAVIKIKNGSANCEIRSIEPQSTS